MSNAASRYPGASPFGDDPVSCLTYFGRRVEVEALRDKVLANRLTLVYARSGLGKTSLLRAGLAPELRTSDHLPIFIRISTNDSSALSQIKEQVQAEARRQGIEHEQTDAACDTADFLDKSFFWRGDHLLTPVLIFDQFEEIFTRLRNTQRDDWFEEVTRLTGNPGGRSSTRVGDLSLPMRSRVHIVISMREDFIGMLEEAIDRIPSIFDNIFRLRSFSASKAIEAIQRPASIAESQFRTPAFKICQDLTSAILEELKGRSFEIEMTTSDQHIEPLFLQIILRKIEERVLHYHGEGKTPHMGLREFGGRRAIRDTLLEFYGESLSKIKPARTRSRVERLCEEVLMTTAGRRLSIEMERLSRDFHLEKEDIQPLLDARLLRLEVRGEMEYLEISHDGIASTLLSAKIRNRRRSARLGLLLALTGCGLSLATPEILLSKVANTESERNTLSNAELGTILSCIGIWIGIKLDLRLFKRASRIFMTLAWTFALFAIIAILEWTSGSTSFTAKANTFKINSESATILVGATLATGMALYYYGILAHLTYRNLMLATKKSFPAGKGIPRRNHTSLAKRAQSGALYWGGKALSFGSLSMTAMIAIYTAGVFFNGGNFPEKDAHKNPPDRIYKEPVYTLSWISVQLTSIYLVGKTMTRISKRRTPKTHLWMTGRAVLAPLTPKFLRPKHRRVFRAFIGIISISIGWFWLLESITCLLPQAQSGISLLPDWMLPAAFSSVCTGSNTAGQLIWLLSVASLLLVGIFSLRGAPALQRRSDGN